MFLHSCDLLEGSFGLEALQGGKKNLKINQKVSRMHSPRLGKLSASPLANSLHQNRASQNEGKRTGRVPKIIASGWRFLLDFGPLFA